MINSQEGCPLAWATMMDKEENKIQWVKLSFELTALLHPTGRCCRAIIPDESSKWNIVGLLVKVRLKDNNDLVEGFRVYLSDRESANAYHRETFNIDGEELMGSIKKHGYILYSLKIHKEIYLENNRKYSCKNYRQNGDYNKVVHNDLFIYRF